MNNYTHIAKLYGIRCYYNIITFDVKGTNWLNRKLLDFCIWFDTIATGGILYRDGFEVTLIEEI